MNEIVKARKRIGWTQAKLAETLGVSQSAVSQWEQGKTLPDMLSAQKLALIFGVSIDELMWGDENPALLPERRIKRNLAKLNGTGLDKVFEYTEDLLASGKYDRGPSFLEMEEADPNGND